MKYKDYYQILGVPRDASREEVKGAYRRLARKYHPDVSKEPDAERRFKEINEANEVLKDRQKRSTYDALGNQWQADQEFRPPPRGGPGLHREFRFDRGDAGQFSDFFSSLFGGIGRGTGGGTESGFRSRGSDQSVRIRITLEESYAGATRRVRVDLPEPDAHGRIHTKPRTLNVRIPAGVTGGQKIRLPGQGQAGLFGGPGGDLYLEVEILPHPLYRLEGRDLHLQLPVAPWEAALGETVSVPTPGGAVKLKIPAGSQSGRRLRLKGRGLPGTPPGDEYVVLEIHTPSADTEQAREFYRRMERELPFDPRARLKI